MSEQKYTHKLTLLVESTSEELEIEAEMLADHIRKGDAALHIESEDGTFSFQHDIEQGELKEHGGFYTNIRITKGGESYSFCNFLTPYEVEWELGSDAKHYGIGEAAEVALGRLVNVYGKLLGLPDDTQPCRKSESIALVDAKGNEVASWNWFAKVVNPIQADALRNIRH